ncbi:C-type lectin lectoxin-Thr1 [Oryzias melastigma]|uniref:C-type lectin lectoxin-Thr1 n=1 Tax=Oryzias melastigma TaxID=30732 RepID=UPI000CF7DCE7|nr:C-type lectin lectoxin-Thr1 [Oryzias melastigma]
MNLTTWNGARDFCRQHHTDLSSLRNDAEYQMVGEVSEGQEVYVGLFRDPWEWSDQTESSLRFWRPTQTVNTAFTDNCVALLRAESGHWGDMECSIERPFLCSYAMKDLQFTKVKVRIQDSTLDPNEPRVQESLLEQMKLELKKTTSIGVRLSWRSGSDGKVFVKKSPPGNV